MKFANQQKFDLTALVQARKGIVDPHRAFLLPGTVICRFADTEPLAHQGPWWFEYSRLSEIRRWAEMNRLAVPHAARALGAVAHSYDAMRVMVCAMVTAPLLAYRGRSKTKFVMKQARLGEMSDMASRADALVEQLYVPGLKDSAIRKACSTPLSVERFEPHPTAIIGKSGLLWSAVTH